MVCLVCGSAGVGKTTVAHSIAYELGQPIKVIMRIMMNQCTCTVPTEYYCMLVAMVSL